MPDDINGISYFAEAVPTREDAERMAQVRTARTAAALPLFAFDAPVTTAEAVIAQAEARNASHHQQARAMYGRAQAAKEFLRASLSDAAFTRLEERRKAYPNSIEYEANAWCGWRREYERTGTIEDTYLAFQRHR